MSPWSVPALVLLTAAGLSPSVSSAPDTLSARQIEHRGRKLAMHPPQHAQATASVANSLDLQAPELKRFELLNTLVMVKHSDDAKLLIDLTVVDDLVGVALVQATLQDAHGDDYVSGLKSINYPQTRARLTLPVTIFGFARSGEWILSSLTVADHNGNQRFYGPEALAAMGNTRFQVVNRLQTDGIAPTVDRGEILTPTVSRSTPPPGEHPDHAGRVGLRVTATDTGALKVSGLRDAYATLCLNRVWPCIFLNGEVLREGQRSGSVNLGNRLMNQEPLGRYQLYLLQVRDMQGNTRDLYHWDTDLDALFGGDASITVTE